MSRTHEAVQLNQQLHRDLYALLSPSKIPGRPAPRESWRPDRQPADSDRSPARLADQEAKRGSSDASGVDAGKPPSGAQQRASGEAPRPPRAGQHLEGYDITV